MTQHELSAVERAFQLARSGDYRNFTEIKKALRREFNVDRELVGRQLSVDVTRICKAASTAKATG